MAKATKILIRGDSMDETFVLRRKMINVQEITYTYETDENGEPIDQRSFGSNPESKVFSREEFSAIGKQSQLPANVTVLETSEGITEEGMEKRDKDNQIGQPFRIDEMVRPAPPKQIDPSKIL